MEQLSWLTKIMPKLFPEAKLDKHQSFLMIYTLASSGEMMLRDYFINLDTHLHQEEIDHSDITELLTTVFYRGLFLENPPVEIVVIALMIESKPFIPFTKYKKAQIIDKDM